MDADIFDSSSSRYSCFKTNTKHCVMPDYIQSIKSPSLNARVPMERVLNI